MRTIVEDWKDITGYEGLYEVSTSGRVRGLKRGKLLRPSRVTGGYLAFGLRKDGKSRTLTAHRIVATTFLFRASAKLEVNHKNGVKTDNRVENLEWITHLENMHHAVRNDLSNQKIPFKLRAKLKELYRSGVSQMAIAAEYGVDQSCVSLIVKNKTHYHED